MEQVTAEEVIFVLMQLGLEQSQAERAAADPLIAWDTEKLSRCFLFVEQSTADRPPAVLWHRLNTRHEVPIPRTTKPKLQLLTADNPGPYICPWCKQDWAVCEGMHGWPAAQRDRVQTVSSTAGREPGATEARPRRTRKGKNTR